MEILNTVIQVVLTEKITFEQRLERGKEEARSFVGEEDPRQGKHGE